MDIVAFLVFLCRLLCLENPAEKSGRKEGKAKDFPCKSGNLGSRQMPLYSGLADFAFLPSFRFSCCFLAFFSFLFFFVFERKEKGKKKKFIL